MWTGYTVVQAKHLSRPRGTEQETKWLLGQLRSELSHWSDRECRRRKKGRLPDNLLIVSNAVLSPTEGGGIEQVTELVQKYAEENGLRGWQVWHYDKLCRLLDEDESVRRAFSGLITVGDVFAQLEALLNKNVAELGDVLYAHAAKTMVADQSGRLQQAGAPMNERLSLASVAVDLPSRNPDWGERVVSRPTLASIVEHADAVWRPSVVGQGVRPHIVLVGGPGQGKTTPSDSCSPRPTASPSSKGRRYPMRPPVCANRPVSGSTTSTSLRPAPNGGPSGSKSHPTATPSAAAPTSPCCAG